MRLSLKIALVLIVVVCAALFGHGFFSVKREIQLFTEETRSHHAEIGRTLRPALVATWLSKGRGAALDLVEEIDKDRRRISVRWVGREALAQRNLGSEALAAVARGEGASFSRKARGPRVLFSYFPVTIRGVVQGAIEIAEPLNAEQRYLRSTIYRTLIIGGIIAAASALVALGLGYWQVGKPVGKLITKARRVGAGDFSGRAALRRWDELAILASEMDAMSDRLEAEITARLAAMAQLRHADRLATVGKLSSGIAHELGTPLNVVSGRGKMLVRDELSRDEVRENGRIIVEQSERITRIIRQLLDFARRRSLKRGPTDLQQLAQKTLDLLAPLAEKARVTMQLQGGPQPTVADVDGGLLQQALANMVMNAIQAMPQGGGLSVAVGRARARPPADPGGPEGEFARLEVRDQGTGIPEGVLEHIFEPFFTTKEVGAGTGLGLSVAYGIVREHGGWIGVETAAGKGSSFSIFLPGGTST